MDVVVSLFSTGETYTCGEAGKENTGSDPLYKLGLLEYLLLARGVLSRWSVLSQSLSVFGLYGSGPR